MSTLALICEGESISNQSTLLPFEIDLFFLRPFFQPTLRGNRPTRGVSALIFLLNYLPAQQCSSAITELKNWGSFALTQLNMASHKRDICESGRPRVCGIGFYTALTTGISVKYGNNKNLPDIPNKGNGLVQRAEVEESSA